MERVFVVLLALTLAACATQAPVGSMRYRVENDPHLKAW